jgi:hypothetical protein
MFKILAHIILTLIFTWVFLIASPYLELKQYAGRFMRDGNAHALELGSTTPPLATDLSEPSGSLKYAWARIAGREDAVYLNIPSNQLSNKIELPRDPAPMILAKYDPSTATGTLAVMKIWQVGTNLRAAILKISPKNFQHFFGMHLYNFAFLQWNPNNDAACNADWANRYLKGDDPPDVDNRTLMQRFGGYDSGKDLLDPLYLIKSELGLQMAKINRSNYYWHQRLNDDPCWGKVALKDFDKDGENFKDISQAGFYRLVTLAMHIHKASVGIIATPNIRQAVQTNVSKSMFKKKVSTTVQYFLSPNFTVVTPKHMSASLYSEYVVNATNTPEGDYSFVEVKGDHNFPVDETLIYQWSQSKSGWTGFFVFIASVVIATVLAVATYGASTAVSLNLSILGNLLGITAGQAVGIVIGLGAISGLIATGFSPTTSVTARIPGIIPEYTAYQLDPSTGISGDAKAIADRTLDAWLKPEVQSTPGGVQVFVSKIDFRRAALCGSASKATDACTENPSGSIVDISMGDSRFKTIFDEMFSNPTKELMQYKYPYQGK